MNEYLITDSNFSFRVNNMRSELNPKTYRKLGDEPNMISKNTLIPYNLSL
tara:strand:- start:20577 stop:20726 length:150 start_codon:yes stop_codon:yes gene_type:complete